MSNVSIRRRWHQRAGFTLIEILIVVAIIAILAAILFPVFSAAREKGRTASCASNLKQLGLAVQIYVSDHDGFYPNYLYPGANCAWPERLQGYVKEPQIFHCPSFAQGEYRPGCPAPDCSVAPCINFRGSYDRNIMNDGSFDFHETKLIHPASTVFLLDGTGGVVNPGGVPIGQPANLTTAGNVVERHQGGDNLLFADGHVKWLSYAALGERNLWVASDS